MVGWDTWALLNRADSSIVIVVESTAAVGRAVRTITKPRRQTRVSSGNITVRQKLKGRSRCKMGDVALDVMEAAESLHSAQGHKLLTKMEGVLQSCGMLPDLSFAINSSN